MTDRFYSEVEVIIVTGRLPVFGEATGRRFVAEGAKVAMTTAVKPTR